MKHTLQFCPSLMDMDTGVAAAATLLVTLGGLMSLSVLFVLACRLIF